ncbi:unnamed protein product, partial [Ectocarpus sp. 12 AP-2014]
QHSGSKEDYSSLGGSTAWRAARTVEGGRACRYSEADALILLSPARNIDILAGQAWEVLSLGKRTEESRPSKSPTTAVFTSAEERDKHPLGYLSSRLLMDAEGRSSFATLDCSLTSFRDAPPAERSWEPVVVSDCVFRVAACVDRHDATRASQSQRSIEPGNTVNRGMQPGTPVRYSKAVQLVHEFSGALLCIDVQKRAEREGFAMKVVLKAIDPPSGDGGSTDGYKDTWWEVKSPGNV